VAADADGLLDALDAIRRGDASEADRAAILAFPEAAPDDGMAMQLRLLARREAEGRRLAGWKIAFTSRGARDSAGAGIRPFGYLLDDGVLRSGAELVPPPGRELVLEPEIGVLIGAPLRGEDVTPEQARAAVSAVVPSFEICERRIPSSAPSVVKIADRMAQWGIVAGEGAAPDLDLAALEVTLRRDGEPVAAGPTTPDVIDDPFRSIARVTALLARHGRGLEPGMRLITGSVLAGVPLAEGVWTADFGPVGEVELRVRR
jgi:2-keto-4-pentenoate hydratase